MKSTIFLLIAAFFLQSSSILFGQEKALPLKKSIHYSHIGFFSAEVVTLVQKILKEPSLFFPDTKSNTSFKSVSDKWGIHNSDTIINNTITSKDSPIILNTRSIMKQGKTADWINLDHSNWQSKQIFINQPVISLGDQQFKVGLGKDGYY